MTEFGALNETPEHTSQTLILITTSAMGRQSVFLYLTSALTSISVSVCSYSTTQSAHCNLSSPDSLWLRDERLYSHPETRVCQISLLK